MRPFGFKDGFGPIIATDAGCITTPAWSKANPTVYDVYRIRCLPDVYRIRCWWLAWFPLLAIRSTCRGADEKKKRKW